MVHQLVQVQVLKQQSSSRPPGPPPSCLTFGTMFFFMKIFYTRWNGTPVFPTFLHLSCQSTEYFHKGLQRVLFLARLCDVCVGLCFLCLFFCCSELLCDFLDELYICSWSHFGRPASPGKVHHRSRLSPFVHNTHTVVFWSLRNGSRLISANDLVSQLVLIVAS